jgi:hypothetical protein
LRVEIDLDAAAKAGVIDEYQALALRNFQSERDGISIASSEKFVLFGGYADLIAAAGLAMILLSLIVLPVAMLEGRLASLPAAFIFSAYLVGLAVACIFAAKRLKLQHLPAVATILLGSALLSGGYAACLYPIAFFERDELHLEDIIVPLFAATGATFFSWQFWRQVRFPLVPAVTCAIWAFCIYVSSSELLNDGHHYGDRSAVPDILLILMGASVLAWAVFWDITDVRRETERSQIAFWLHCSAGFMITHSIANMVGILGRQPPDLSEMLSTGSGLFILFHIAVATLVSVILDRRTLFSGACLSLLFVKISGGFPIGLPITGVLLLSVTLAWTPLRERVLAFLPVSIKAQLPRTSIVHNTRRPTRQWRDYWVK